MEYLDIWEATIVDLVDGISIGITNRMLSYTLQCSLGDSDAFREE